MWPRVVEILLGVWLAVSTLVLPSEDRGWLWQLTTVIGGALQALLAVLSFWPRMRRAHLAEIPGALVILGIAYATTSSPAPAVVQSAILTAFLVLNFAIIPSPATMPPRSWYEFQTSH